VKRFEFRLEKVLKLKRQRQRLAELRQQQAQLVVDGIRQEIVKLQADLKTTAASLEGHIGRPMTAGEWVSLYEHTGRLGKILKAKEERLEQAERDLRAALAQRTKITTEVEALLALHDQQWQAHWQDTLSAEQAHLEDQAMRRWHAARAADSRQGERE
jgi:flagellar protein FliJ